MLIVVLLGTVEPVIFLFLFLIIEILFVDILCIFKWFRSRNKSLEGWDFGDCGGHKSIFQLQQPLPVVIAN